METALYIHIPFCKEHCIYCDFFSTTHLHLRDIYIHRLCKELKERKNYLPPYSVKTIYFGGGTPSLLSKKHFEQLFQSLEDNQYYERGREKEYEITLEVNPKDVHHEYSDTICSFPFNRISIGIQSFQDDELQWLGRKYHAKTALQSILYFQQLKYQNISIDLLYGLPGQSLYTLRKTIDQAIKLNIQHISTYHLTYKKNTLLHHQLQKKNIQPIEEETSIKMEKMLRDTLLCFGFKQYEISNFARSSYISKHNTFYWTGNHYIGIGASAHSYNGKSRQYNMLLPSRNIIDYKPKIEIISKKTAYNEFIITRLRTMQGISLNELESNHGQKQKEHCLFQARKYLTANFLEITQDHLRLTPKGIRITDRITCDLLS